MKEAGIVVATMFLSRDQAHREHLKTKSFAQHAALGSFYEEVVDLADKFAETYQGMYGIVEIPFLQPTKGSIDAVLEHQIVSIEECRECFKNKSDSVLLNIIDEISVLYSQTLYKLRNLK